MNLVMATLLLLSSRAQASEWREDFSNWKVANEEVATLINSCLSAQSCGVLSAETRLLGQILEGLSREVPLAFVSAKSQPALFAAAGTHRIAVTGSQVADAIYVNADEANNASFETALSILVHEYGHHHGVKDTEDRVLDVLGAKLRAYYTAKAETIDLGQAGSPNFKLRLFQPVGAKAGGTSTRVIFTDGASTINLMKSRLDAVVGCPYPGKRIGGLLATQARSEGAFDRNPISQRDELGIRYEVQSLCEEAGQRTIEYITLRDVLALTKDHASIESIESTAVSRGVTDYRELFQNPAGLPLRMIELKSESRRLAAGGVWQIHAVVEAPGQLEFSKCAADFTSPSMVNFGFKPRVLLDFSECQFSSLGGSRYAIDARFTFPAATVARDYVLHSVSLKIKDQDLSLTGYPSREERISVTAAKIGRPLAIDLVGLASRAPSGENVFVDPKIDLSKPSNYDLPVDSLHALQIGVRSSAPLSERTKLSLQLAWREPDQQEFAYAFPLYAKDSFKDGWHIPLGGGTEVANYPGQADLKVISISLRGLTKSGVSAGRRMLFANYEWLWVLNENLEELFVPMNVQVTGQ